MLAQLLTFTLSLLSFHLHLVRAFDPSGLPWQCEAPCGQADLEGFNACFDLVMSKPCRSRLCEKWYVNTTMTCLTCVTDHVTGTELENFTSIIDVYNSTCHNRSLVSDDAFLNGTYLNGSTVNPNPTVPEPTMFAPQPASAVRLAVSGGLVVLAAGGAVLL